MNTSGPSKPSAKTSDETSAIWGGRFETGPDQIMARINASIGFDRRLFAHDLTASRAHCRMLAACDIISQDDGKAILAGLDRIEQETEAGEFTFDPALEDIHMNIEQRLGKLIGEPAQRLHTARSRNDQVATDFRLWVRDAIDETDARLAGFQNTLLDRAAAHADSVMPGFTHLQAAQPITLGHHLMAYFEMTARDRARFNDCRRRLNECPLGAAALAGTSFAIDRTMTAKALGFDRPCANSLDAVSDRDFALEFLSTATITIGHLSRLAEEIVIWASPPFGFVTLPDAFSTGSSIMPQKRNPDAAELVRAKVGRIAGAFQTLVMVMKGLPLAYSKDMQEDKEPVFDAADNLILALAALTGLLAGLSFKVDRMAATAGHGFSTATDLADWLVRAHGLAFRRAHHVTGQLVKLAEDKGCALAELALADMQAVEPEIDQAVYEVLSVEKSVASRTSPGGTAPVRVREAIAAARKALK